MKSLTSATTRIEVVLIVVRKNLTLKPGPGAKSYGLALVRPAWHLPLVGLVRRFTHAGLKNLRFAAVGDHVDVGASYALGPDSDD